MPQNTQKTNPKQTLSAAAVFLRLGLTMVAYMVIFSHLLMLALVPQTKCTGGDGADIWVAVFALSPLTFIFTLLLLSARPLHSVVQILKWGCLPLVILVPLALIGTLPIFSSTTLGGAPICPGISAYSNLVFQQAWGPLQLGLIALIAIQATRFWMMAGEQAESERLGLR